MKLSEHGSEAVTFSTIGAMTDPHVIARFAIEGEPQSKARAKFTVVKGRPRAYTPAATTRAEAVVLQEYLKVARPEHRKDSVSTFGVVAVFHVVSMTRDVDNMVKLVLDALNEWAWLDDRQVTEVVGRKVMAFPFDEPRTDIVIYRTGTFVGGRTAPCAQCGEQFRVTPSEIKRGRKFCTRDCRTAAMKAARVKDCPQCGKSFEAHSQARGQFCSPECKVSASRVPATCAACGASFEIARSAKRSRTYCSDTCKATYWRNQRKSAAKGTCHDCGGPTTKKTYKRCRDCSYAAGGRHADRP